MVLKMFKCCFIDVKLKKIKNKKRKNTIIKDQDEEKDGVDQMIENNRKFINIINNEWNVKKFLLVGDKFMSKIYLRQPRSTHSTYWPFATSKERTQKKSLKEHEIPFISLTMH